MIKLNYLVTKLSTQQVKLSCEIIKKRWNFDIQGNTILNPYKNEF